MALSLDPQWDAAINRADPEVRVLVRIEDGTNTWRSVSGRMRPFSDLRFYDVAVNRVSQLGVTLDPVSRKTQIGAIQIDVLTDWIKPIAVNNRIDKKRIRVFFGGSELDEAAFASFFVGTIENIIPNPDQPEITQIEAHDLITNLERNVIVGAWFNKHPAECIYDTSGQSILEKAGLQVADIDTASFDRTASQFTGMKNAIVTRADVIDIHQPGEAHFGRPLAGGGYEEAKGLVQSGSVRTPTSALALAQEVCEILFAHLDFDETGKMRLVKFDPTASNLDTWDQDSDILPGSFQQEASAAENVINRVNFTFGGMGDKVPRQTYRADDTASQSDFAFPGQDERIESIDINSPWLGGGVLWINSLTQPTDTSFTAWGPHSHSMSGNRADMTVSASEPVYCLIEGVWPDEYAGFKNVETVKCEGLTRFTDTYSLIYWYDPELGKDLGWVYPGGGVKHETPSCRVEYTSVTRAFEQPGESGLQHLAGRAYVYDMTIPVVLSEILLKRFKNGAPIVSLETNLSKFAYQIGDFVGLVVPEYFAFGVNGLDGSETWEIIGKETDIMGGRIAWTLTLVNDDALTKTGRTNFGNLSWTPHAKIRNREVLTEAAKLSGLGITWTAGLTAQIAAGYASDGGSNVGELEVAQDNVFTANRDTYVSIDLWSGALMFREVANGAAAPDFLSEEAILGKVVTNATQVTSIDTNISQSALLNGGKVLDGTIDTAQIADLAIASGKIQSLAVTEGKIDTGAVTENKIGALAVTEGKIGSLAVTSGKIGANAVIAGKLANGSIDATGRFATQVIPTSAYGLGTIGTSQTLGDNIGRNSNFDFGQWSRG